jgi:hypothetical protein
LEIHDGGARAHHLSNFPKIAADIGDQPGTVKKERQETVIEIVAFQDVTLLAACDDVLGQLLSSFGKRNNVIPDFRIGSAAEIGKPPAAIAAQLSGDIRVFAERADLSHQPQL